MTTIKDAAFGLGYHPRKDAHMAAAVVDLVAGKPRHAGTWGHDSGLVRTGRGVLMRWFSFRGNYRGWRRVWRVLTSDCTLITSKIARPFPHRSITPSCRASSSAMVKAEVGTRGGAGEYARLVPRDPVSSLPSLATTTSTSSAMAMTTATRQGRGDEEKDTATQPQVMRMLEELNPSAAVESLPGMGISFVKGGERVNDGASLGRRAEGGGREEERGGKQRLSVFERECLEKARARQRDRIEKGEPQARERVKTNRIGGRSS